MVKKHVNIIFLSLAIHTCNTILTQNIQTPKLLGWMANRVDPDQMPYSAASELGLYCLLQSVPILRVNMTFIGTRTKSKRNWRKLSCIVSATRNGHFACQHLGISSGRLLFIAAVSILVFILNYLLLWLWAITKGFLLRSCMSLSLFKRIKMLQNGERSSNLQPYNRCLFLF